MTRRSARARSFVTLSLVLLGLAPACGGDPVARPDRGAASSADVYRVSIASAGSPDKVEQVEWFSPATGEWRIEGGGRTKIYTSQTYATIEELSVTVRQGSDAYLGSLSDSALSAAPLREYDAGTAESAGIDVDKSDTGKTELRFLAHGTPLIATVEEVLTEAAADERRLFTIPFVLVTSRSTERSVGEPASFPLRVYWFGSSFGDREPVIAVEHESKVTPEQLQSRGWSKLDEARAHMTFYELPAAEGKSSALHGQTPPPGEIQVVNQAIDSPIAQSAIDRFNGIEGEARFPAWPRSDVTLANGERAVVIPERWEGSGDRRTGFAVITNSTLVFVLGEFTIDEIPSTAAALRPLNP